jgi:mRNA interferase MazF
LRGKPGERRDAVDADRHHRRGRTVALLDERAARSGRSRSSLIREAIEAYLADDVDARIDAAIVAGYRRRPQEPDAWADAAAREGDRRRALVTRVEIWWAEHPEAGRRPFLVLTREAAIPVVNRVVAVPATRTIRGIPTELELDEDDGMPTRCALSFDYVTTVPKALLTERICRLVERLAEACRALSVATGC